jgi:esterase/lipase superfamily enzyme
MQFVTNRRLREGRRSAAGRLVTFDLDDNEPGVSLFFCERAGPGRYLELLAVPFLDRLKAAPEQQILLFLHGYNCLPEAGAFPAAERLQGLCDRLAPGLVQVVALVWPCDDDPGLVLDYWDDQAAADASAPAMARALGKLVAWIHRASAAEPCLKHINVLAHSMGNRVLARALAAWSEAHGCLPALFRSIFMLAPDLPNDCFATQGEAAAVAEAARHVVVYHAADDFALRSSKIANVRHRVLRRRLGHTGPVALAPAHAHVVAIDCDDFNSAYDRLGHSYFLDDAAGEPGAALRHLVETMRAGRVAGLGAGERRLTLAPLDLAKGLAINAAMT